MTTEINRESENRASEPAPGLVTRLRRTVAAALFAFVLAAIEVGGERPLRTPTPIILLRDEDIVSTFPRIRPYRAHYRRHARLRHDSPTGEEM